MMSGRIAQFLERVTSRGNFQIGQIAVFDQWVLSHMDDVARQDELELIDDPERAVEIARYDDQGNYRPLKTAPNLRHGWKLRVDSLVDLRLALDAIYPAAMGTLAAFEAGELPITPLRETLGRQTGMYRVTQLMTDDQAKELNLQMCTSQGGCLRRVLWEIREGDPAPLTEPIKKVRPAIETTQLPILCAEACNLLVAAARPIAKSNLPSPATNEG